MKVKYWIYQIRCKVAGKQDLDYIEWLGRTLFFREGVRV